MDSMDREFFKRYHRAAVKAHSSDLEKFKAKIGSDWAEEFREKAGGRLEGDDFDRALEEYLIGELRFCARADVESDGDGLNIGVRGCHICFANEELKKEGEASMCPIVPTGLFSISRVGGRRASLRGVNKNGVVGECEIQYDLD